MAEQSLGKHLDEVETAVKEALKPMPPDTRPRIYPVVETAAQPTATDKPWEPQRTLTQLLLDIETLIGGAEKHLVEDFALFQSKTLEILGEHSKNTAKILNDMHQRISAIENSIGVR